MQEMQARMPRVAYRPMIESRHRVEHRQVLKKGPRVSKTSPQALTIDTVKGVQVTIRQPIMVPQERAIIRPHIIWPTMPTKLTVIWHPMINQLRIIEESGETLRSRSTWEAHMETILC